MYSGFEKHPSFVFLLLLIVGISAVSCGSRMKNSLTNFSAYYNTFYNANQSFDTGLRKQEVQQRNYNPERPIRIHPEPVNAGNEDFQVAIEKSADVIRKFGESKWVDDAVELIGKSYYYRKEFFSADQKFQELYQAAEDPEVKQRAVLWRGRTYLDMQLHEQAINFLNGQLSLFEGDWNPKLLAETQSILAQHYIALENWERGEEFLRTSLDDLPSDELKSRGYFLYGQILQKTGKLVEAEEAYNRVENYFKNYELLYYANLKKAQVNRSLGNNNKAYKLLSDMARDDKNVDQIVSLQYELGRTEQERGNIDRAEQLYTSILRNNRNRPDAVTLAKTYYALGEINQKHYNDFKMAAAYYDSAASQRASSELLSDEFNASELARSYGEYSRLRTEIAKKDSLLRLGSLSEAELDSVILEIKKQRKAELEQEMREAENRRNTLVTVNAQNQQNSSQNSSTDGFLNYKNPVMLADARAQFQAVWGNRPLADNWRRISDIQSSITSENEIQNEVQNGVFFRNQSIRLSDIQVDLSDIPFTAEAKDSVKKNLGELNFQLGNLFFLSLDMPDSAEHYYSNVLNGYPDSEAVPVALYSLAELKSSMAEMKAARNYAGQLIRKFPNSVYAERLADEFKMKLDLRRKTYDTTDSLRMVFNETLTDTKLPDSLKAIKLKLIADKNPEVSIAPEALFQSAILYASLAKDSAYYTRFQKWDSTKTVYQNKLNTISVLKDSAEVILADTSLDESRRMFWQSIADSTLEEPQADRFFPYKGVYWDSTRAALSEFDSRYKNHSRADEVKKLLEELSLPASTGTIFQNTEEKAELSSDNRSADTISESYIPCLELNKVPAVKGGKKAFLEDIFFTGNNVTGPVTGEARYLFFINTDGEIDSYQQLSRSLEPGITNALEKAIENSLSFEPIYLRGEAVSVQCEIVFPLSENPQN